MLERELGMANQEYQVAVEEDGFLDEVCSVPGGECVNWCVQCGMCAASCPSVSWMDYSPRKMIALIRASVSLTAYSSVLRQGDATRSDGWRG